MGDEKRKLEKIKQKRGLELFCLLGGNSSGFSRLIMLFYGNRHRPCH